MLNSVVCFYFAAWGKQMNQRGHLLESSGQAGCCVFFLFLFKKPSVFKFTLNMTTHLVTKASQEDPLGFSPLTLLKISFLDHKLNRL